MIKFSVQITKTDIIKTLLKDIASDYITLFVERDLVYFVYKSPEVYMHRVCVVLEANNLNDIIVMRIEKKDFMTLLSDGRLDFSIDNNRVNIDFYDEKGGLNYSLDLGFQEDLFESYAEQIELFSRCKEYPEINLKGTEGIIKICKSLGTSMSCDGETVHANTKGIFIFSKYESQPFTVNSKLLDSIRRVSTLVYSVKNYIVYNSDELCIAITKNRHVEGCEFEHVTQAKSSHMIKFNCQKMIGLVKKLKLGDGDFHIDFEKKIAYFTAENRLFKTPIEVLETKTAKGNKEGGLDLSNLNLNTVSASVLSSKATLPTLIIPSLVLKGVLNNIIANEGITILIKKEFVVLKVNGVVCAFRKVFKND